MENLAKTLLGGGAIMGIRNLLKKKKKPKKFKQPEILKPMDVAPEYIQQNIADYKARQAGNQMTIGSTALTSFKQKRKKSLMSGYNYE